MISSRPTEAAIHVAIMRSWRPLGRTFFRGVVGSAILFVAKANPADAPDQKAPTGGVSTANLSNQWAEERRVESGRIENALRIDLRDTGRDLWNFIREVQFGQKE
jgi:hypothetical protein